MNRKQFLVAMAGGAAAAAQTPTGFKARRKVYTHTGEIGAPPEAIFPLLCPVREYEWLDGWKCEMVYSDSGVAEDNCIFTTAYSGTMTWNVSRYEPPQRIEFVGMIPDMVLMRLNIVLEKVDRGTRITWTRMFTSLSEAGHASLGSWNNERSQRLNNQIEYFLRTGKMLRNAG
jgi:hypothetical protein